MWRAIITGATAPQYVAEKDDIETVIHDQIDTTIEAQMPLGYLIPPAWKDVADLLALHGVTMERTAKPITQEFETYRFGSLTTANGGDGIGRMMFSFNPAPRLVKEKITIPQGAYWVPMKQRRARLILAALEPEAPDSFVRYGYLYAAIGFAGGRGGGGRGGAGGGGGRGGAPTGNAGRGPAPTGGMPAEYLSEPIARKTMADNPDLGQGVSGEGGVRPGVCRRPHGAPPLVVRAFEVRAVGQRAVSHRARLGEKLVRAEGFPA